MKFKKDYLSYEVTPLTRQSVQNSNTTCMSRANVCLQKYVKKRKRHADLDQQPQRMSSAKFKQTVVKKNVRLIT